MIRAIAARQTQVGFPPEHPSVWQPGTIVNPCSGLYFTDRSAWQFIQSLLESNFPFNHTYLAQPPSKDAYELLVEVGYLGGPLYIKVAFNGVTAIGRSFHYSSVSGSTGTKPSFLS